jgi:hypothetical protein
MTGIMLRRASASRPSGTWSDDDFDVLADGVVVGRVFHAAASPVGSPWMWTLAFEQHENRTPTHGYAASREAAITAFAKSWRAKQTTLESKLERGAGGDPLRPVSGVPPRPRRGPRS